MGANTAFLARAINRCQGLSIEEPFCLALNDFIMEAGVLAWDDDRALFWVKHPYDGWQVAVWFLPIAAKFEPLGVE